jgi:hypothetical protein
MKLSRDTNGNKTLSITKRECGLGFSIQTLGNLPKTHTMTKAYFNSTVAMGELINHVKAYGTPRQKLALGVA